MGVLPMERFLQGHTFFVQRLHAQRQVAPVHVHVTYTMGADFGKQWRLRAAGLWGGATGGADSDYYTRGDFVHVTGVEDLVRQLLVRMELPAAVWRCEGPISTPDANVTLADAPSAFFDHVPGFGDSGAGSCYHPKHLVTAADTANLEAAVDPAAPHVAVQFVLRHVVRNALALAQSLGRRLVLPRLWSLCERHWWQLKDCRTPGVDLLPMPYEAPLDVAFDAVAWSRIRSVDFVESSFLDHPRAPAELRQAAARLSVGPSSVRAVAEGEGGRSPGPRAHLPSGVPFDGAALNATLPSEVRGARLLLVDAASLLRLSRCGFHDGAQATTAAAVAALAFSGQYSYCSEERNPFIEPVLREAKRLRIPEEHALNTRRNCTGQPANAFNKPKVDMGAAALAFERGCADGATGGGLADAVADGAERILERALTLVGLPRRRRVGAP